MEIDLEIVEILKTDKEFYEKCVAEAQAELEHFQNQLERTKRLLDVMQSNKK